MGILVSLPVSLILLWIVLAPKKTDPFPKGGLLRLFVAGAICTVVASVLYFILAAALTVSRIGTDAAAQIVNALKTDPNSVPALLASIKSARAQTPLQVLFATFITAGLLEELCKYFAGRAAIRKEGMIRTRMDAVICFAVVAITFEVLENILYGQGDVVTALVRNLVPVHFSCGVIMGWYFGKSLATGKKVYRFAAVLVPAAIHTLYDTALSLMPAGEAGGDESIFIILGLAAFAGAFVLSVVTAVKLVRWRRKGTLAAPLPGAAVEAAAPAAEELQP